MDKMRAFTIIELIVVLIISSLLILFSTSVLLNFNQYLKKTITDRDFVNDIFSFSIRLKEDIVKADYVTGNTEVLRIYKDGRVKTYEVYPGKIVVNTVNTTDTVKFSISNIDIDYLTTGIVNYIEMKISKNGQEYAINQHKEYSSRFLFEQRRN